MDSCAAVVEGQGWIVTNHVLNRESYTSAGRRVAQPIFVPSGLMRFANFTQPKRETRDVRIVSTGGGAAPPRSPHYAYKCGYPDDDHEGEEDEEEDEEEHPQEEDEEATPSAGPPAKRQARSSS